MEIKHILKEIVKDNMAVLSYVCNGICYYNILVENIKYQFQIDTKEIGNETQYWATEYKAVTLMSWVRESLENETFMQINLT